WIASGIALVGMETLADFGAVSVFNYDTFTTAIYRVWSGLFSMSAALQLSGVLLLFVVIALLIERRSRAGARFASSRDASREAPRMSLSPARQVAALAFVSLVFLLAFALPVLQLAHWAVARAASDFDARYFG